MTAVVPFSIAGHLCVVEVRVDSGRPATFVFDTGIGITVVSDALLHELGHPLSGRTHTGRRMTGQEITSPLSELDEIELAGLRQTRPVVASLDVGRFKIDSFTLGGFLSLSFFERTPVTIDFTKRELVLHDGADAGDPTRWGETVPLDIHRDGPEVDSFLELELPGGRRVKVEVDTGSSNLILHSRYMNELGVHPGAPGVIEKKVTDDFGFSFVQYRARLPGPLRVADAPAFAQDAPETVFMDIIYDGLVGYDFLRAYRTTFDLARSRLFLARPG